MYREKTNIILIGMPGSGKSTIGAILAKTLGKKKLDTDILIQNVAKMSLQDIIDKSGHLALREIEERVLIDIHCHHHIIATGGSAVYSEAAMSHLGKDGLIVFLHTNFNTLKSRVQNYETRGLAKRHDQNFQDLFVERLALYEKYANITIKGSKLTKDQICAAICQKIKN